MDVCILKEFCDLHHRPDSGQGSTAIQYVTRWPLEGISQGMLILIKMLIQAFDTTCD